MLEVHVANTHCICRSLRGQTVAIACGTSAGGSVTARRSSDLVLRPTLCGSGRSEDGEISWVCWRYMWPILTAFAGLCEGEQWLLRAAQVQGGQKRVKVEWGRFCVLRSVAVGGPRTVKFLGYVGGTCGQYSLHLQVSARANSGHCVRHQCRGLSHCTTLFRSGFASYALWQWEVRGR